MQHASHDNSSLYSINAFELAGDHLDNNYSTVEYIRNFQLSTDCRSSKMNLAFSLNYRLART